MSTVALFTIPRTWKQPRCSSRDKWTKKLWYKEQWNITHHKKEWIESVLVSWMNLEPFIHCEVSQKEKKNKYHILTHIYGI